MKSLATFGMAALLTATLVACNSPAAKTQDTNGESGEIGDATKNVVVFPYLARESPQVFLTQATGTKEGTLAAAVTLTPQPSTSTGGVTITSSEDTNCRKGPGVMYEIVGHLLVGQTSEVVAKYQNGKFWLIKDPANPTQECWVWDETTKTTGNVASLPDATPPATPSIVLNLGIYAVISPITYDGGCPVVVELVGNYTVNTPVIISYQWYIGDVLVSNGAVTAGASGTFSSSDQITITGTTTNPIRLKASAGPKNVTTSAIAFNITCH